LKSDDASGDAAVTIVVPEEREGDAASASRSLKSFLTADSMKPSVLAMTALAVIVSACGSPEKLALPAPSQISASSANAPPIDPSLDIAYMTQNDGATQTDLYLLRSNGSQRRLILSLPGQAYLPDWAPGGDSLVFTWEGHPEGTGFLWIVRADGSGLRPVSTSDLTYEADARWSPDGQSLAFFHMVTDDIYDIGITKTDGSDLRLLLNGQAQVLGVEPPAWSPDGKQIAFEAADANYNQAGLFVANLDGSGLHQLTQSANDQSVRWSPDGTRLAYTQWNGLGVGFRFKLMVSNADGSNPQALTTDVRDYYPTWSPNGKTIAFIRLPNPPPYYCSVYTMSAEGGTPVEITPDLHPRGCAGIAWRPRRNGNDAW